MADARLSNASRTLPSTEDAFELARRRLPRLIFDFIDGAAGQGLGAGRNRSAFRDIGLMPRVRADAGEPSLPTEFLGRTHAMPFGIAPKGMSDLALPGTDQAFAHRAAHDCSRRRWSVTPEASRSLTGQLNRHWLPCRHLRSSNGRSVKPARGRA